jgi:hypothetical protein
MVGARPLIATESVVLSDDGRTEPVQPAQLLLAERAVR